MRTREHTPAPRTRRSHAWAAGVAVALLGLGAPRAQASDAAAAEALFRDGMAALERGHLEEACAQLRESHALEPAPGTAFHLADCEERRGRFGTAWALFAEARSRLEPRDERRPLVEGRLTALEPRLSRLRVTLAPGTAADARVLRDGVELGAGGLGSDVVVDPGKHVVRVEAPGRAPRDYPIAIGEAKTAVIEVAAGQAAPDGEPTGSDDSALVGAGLASGAVGLVAMGVGIGLGVAASGRYDAVAAECPNNACTPEAFAERMSARTQGDVGTGLFVGGAVFLAAGIVLEIVALASPTSSESGADEAIRSRPGSETTRASRDGLRLSAPRPFVELHGQDREGWRAGLQWGATW